MATKDSLWISSSAWRWAFVLTILLTGISLLANPWRHHRRVVQGNASYSSPNPPPAIASSSPRTGTVSQSIPAPASSPTLAAPAASTAINPAFDAQIEIKQNLFPAGTEIHMIGVYEAEAPPGTEDKPWWANCTAVQNDRDAMQECHRKYASKRTMRDVEVNIVRGSSPMVLVLSAYDPVSWRVNNAASAKILKVLLGGHHAQDIQGIPANVPVEAFTYETPLCSSCSRASGYFYAYEQNSAEFARAAKMVRDNTGLQTINFQGSYKSHRFNVLGGSATQSAGGMPEKFVGNTFTDEISIDGRVIPLPDGRWVGLVKSSNPASRGSDTLAALGRIDSSRLMELFAVRVQSARDGQGYASFRGCQSASAYKHQIATNESFGSQSCFEVIHFADAWKQPLLAAASAKAIDMGATHPDHVVASIFHQANMTGSLDIVHYSIPDTAIAGLDTEWHLSRIKADKRKEAFAQAEATWAETWNQIISQTKY